MAYYTTLPLNCPIVKRFTVGFGKQKEKEMRSKAKCWVGNPQPDGAERGLPPDAIPFRPLFNFA
jgi:hypothetical protein